MPILYVQPPSLASAVDIDFPNHERESQEQCSSKLRAIEPFLHCRKDIRGDGGPKVAAKGVEPGPCALLLQSFTIVIDVLDPESNEVFPQGLFIYFKSILLLAYVPPRPSTPSAISPNKPPINASLVLVSSSKYQTASASTRTSISVYPFSRY